MPLEDLPLPYSTDTQFLNVTVVLLYIVARDKSASKIAANKFGSSLLARRFPLCRENSETVNETTNNTRDITYPSGKLSPNSEYQCLVQQ